MPLPAPKLQAGEPVPFTEAIEWYRQQAPWISGSSWETMTSIAAEVGEYASQGILLNMLDDVWSKMDRAVAEGKPYGDFVRDVATLLESKWYSVDSARLRLIYHNNVGNALMAGRYAQLTDPDVLEDRPFWLFDGIADSIQSDRCRSRDGIVLPADHVWWKTNSPLLHHACRSGIISLDEDEAKTLGKTKASALKGLEPAAEGWGKPYSWEGWKPRLEHYHEPLADEYRRWATGKDYLHDKASWDAKWQGWAKAKFPQAAVVNAPLRIVAEPTAEQVPDGAIVWGKRAKFDGAELNGVKIQPGVDGYWKTIPDVVTGEPAMPDNLGAVSTGVLVQEPDGRIWLVEPKDHFGGYLHSFPKGKLSATAGLTGQQNALKELFEEAGLTAEITGYVGDFKGTTGVTRYYLAKRTGGAPWQAHWETHAVKLMDLHDAEQALNKDRDKEVLAVLGHKAFNEPIPAGLKAYVYPAEAKPAAPMPPDPVAAPALAPAAPAYPFGLNPAGFVYSAPKTTGSTPGMIVAHPDAPGRTFMLKKLDDPLKAQAELAGGKLYGLTNPDMVGVELLDPKLLPEALRGSAKLITLQEMEQHKVELQDVVGPKGSADYKKLSTEQQAELIAHGVASWMTGEHDGHAGQYFLKGGHLVRIDLGQALKYTLTTGDKLDLDYHPNAAFGEAKPAHLQLLYQMFLGKIDTKVLHHPLVKTAVDKAAALTPAQIDKALSAYGDMKPGGKSREEIVALLTARSLSVKKDFAKLFAEVTGEKFDWKESVQQVAQPQPKPAPQDRRLADVPKIRAGVTLQAADDDLQTFGAVTMSADGDKLRGQAWRVQRHEQVTRVSTKQVYTFLGELDSSIWPAARKALKAQGATVESWTTYTATDQRRGVLRTDGNQASSFLGSALVLKTPKYKVTFGDQSANQVQRGQVRIEVYEKDPEAAQKAFKEALVAAGLEKHGLDRKPTKEEARLALLNRVLWNVDGGSAKPSTSAEDLAVTLRAKGVKEVDLTTVQNSLGYNEPRINGRWKDYRKDGTRFLYHQFTAEPAPLLGISGASGGKGGLLSTVAREENGITRRGMSSGEDQDTGGASSAFTRLVGDPQSDAGSTWFSTHHYTAIFSPKALDRADWYGFTSDNYGCTTDASKYPHKFSERLGADAFVKQVAKSGGQTNEIMFRNAVAREDILLFAVATESQRAEALKTLKDAGVKTIRGQPLDQMVVVMKSPADYSRLTPSNPVHMFLMGQSETYPDWEERYGDEK